LIKFAFEDNGQHIVGLGLSEGNVKALKEGKPIVFPCSEVGIADTREVVIVYDDDDFRSQWEKLLSPTRIAYCLCINDETFEDLRNGVQIANSTAQAEFVMFYGETEEKIIEMVKPGIGPATRVISKGFNPTDPNNNIQGQN
jgi:hypothetical protein